MSEILRTLFGDENREAWARKYDKAFEESYAHAAQIGSSWVAVGYDEAASADNIALVAAQPESVEPGWMAQYLKAARRRMQESMATKFWPEPEERGFGARDIKDRIADAKAAGKLPPFKPIEPPTHTHTLRLPTPDHDARLGCARWWP